MTESESLKNISEFKASPEIRNRLQEYGYIKFFDAGDVIQNDQSYIRAIPIVLNGSIRVMRLDESDQEILLYYIKAGESCIMSFLGGIHNETSKVKALAEERTEILFIPVDKVTELIKEFPEWLDYIFRLYHKRFEELLDVVNSFAFKKMDERIFHLLQMKVANTGDQTISVTHEQLATELGTSRVVVSRILGKMESDGLLQLGRNRIVLKK